MSDTPIEAVLREYTDRLMSLPGVVGVAQGERSGRSCILVFVEKKAPGLLRQIPAEIEGYPVEVDETGRLEAPFQPD